MDGINIGANIKKIRKKKGLTQTQLANLIGTSKQMISVWENSERELTFTTVVKIAKSLEVDIGELFQTSNELHELSTKCDIAQNPQPSVVSSEEKNEPSIAFVKSDGFEKTVCFVWSLLDLTYKVMKAYGGFHLEADFDPEALNTYFKFYPPIKAKGNGSDDTKQEKGDVNLNEYKKQISEERELLHRQLELLAERSKHCTDNKELVELSAQMVSIYTTLKNVNCHR